MKKIAMWVLIVLVILSTSILSLTFKKNNEPIVIYNVYLDGELIGKVDSKTKLEKYIDEEQIEIKQKYNVDNVLIPNGLEMKKELSYDATYDDVSTVYDRIKEKSDFTIEGYQITIKSDNSSEKIYVLEKNIFDESIENVIKAYVGSEKYEAYKNKTQEEVKETGSYIMEIYIDNNITIKEYNIPSSEKIYTDSKELSSYLLFGKNAEKKIHTVDVGETIDQIAYNYEINVEEFLLSNPKYKKNTNLLSVGEEVVIGVPDPKINVTVLQETTEDLEEMYKTIEKLDSTMIIGYEYVEQQGQKGVIRTKQSEKIVNGTIVYAKQISKETIKPAVDKIVLRGSKYVSYVGDLKNWYWPTDSYKITSDFVYRISPITHQRELHGAIDIANAHGAKIYAANSGTIYRMARDNANGIHVIINHNNGYYTQYNHMSAFNSNLKPGQTVEKGQVIGYIGMTGYATGPHLHFAVWYGGAPYTSKAVRVNPWTLFR